MRLKFIGAAHMVTGSCYLLQIGDDSFLVDCGMFQGAKRIRELNYEGFPFNPAEIRAVFFHLFKHVFVADICAQELYFVGF